METSLKEKQSAFQEINIAIGNQHVNALAIGDGPAIVLFHSLLADRSSFNLIAGPLSETHQVIMLNLPGFGPSDRVDGSLEDIADRIAAAINGFGFKQPPIFLGNGYGGFIAAILAIRHPGIAARLVVAGCGAAFSEPGRAAFRQMSSMAKEKGLTAIADVAMRRLFSPEFQSEHPALMADRRQCFLAVDPHTFYNACDALASLDFRDQLPTLTIPVLVLVGEHDEATPPSMAHELAEGLPNGSLHVLSGCAHVPQLQEPGRFLLAIRHFIDAN